MEILTALIIIVLLLVAVWLWAIAPQLINKPDFAALKKYDYAHRGLHNRENGVPENSLKAFSMAVLGGFGMELDLQLTKDNKVVVHHDHSIKRSCGEDKLISDLTYEQLQLYRLFGTEEKIPLFSDVLKLVDGKTPMIIELKGYNDTDTLCRLAMKELEGYKGLYCVESFDPRIVSWFKENRPEIIRGQLMEKLKKGDNGLSAPMAFFGRNMMTNFLTRPNFEAYDFKERDILSMKAARGIFGMQEVSWTIRDEESFKKVKALGNLCIFENFVPETLERTEKMSYEDILKSFKKKVYASEMER